jgi:hypothetical protein
MMVRQSIVHSCCRNADHRIPGSNLSVSALLFWLNVQIFAQSLSASESPVDPAASETRNAPGDSAEHTVPVVEHDVASVPETEESAAVEIAADSANS